MVIRSSSSPSGASLGRRLVRAGSSLAVAKVAATIATLLNYRLIATRLPDEDVALFLVINSIAGLGAIIAGLGLGPLVVRRVRAAELRDDSSASAATIRRALAMILPACLIAAASLALLPAFLPEWFSQGVQQYCVYAAVWLALAVLAQFYGEAARGYERFGVTALVNSLNGGLLPNALLLAFLLVSLPWLDSLQTVLVGQLIGLGVAVVVGWAGARPGAVSSRATRELQHRLDRPEENNAGRLAKARGMLTESLPLLASQLSVMGLIHLEILLLKDYAPAREVAAYGAVRYLMLVVRGPLLLINASLPTFVVELFAQGKTAQLQQLLRGTATAAMLAAIAPLAVMLLVPSACLAFFHPNYTIAWPALMLLAAANAVFIFTGSCGYVLRMTGFERWSLACGLASGAFYLAVAPWAAKHYSMMGIASATATLVILRNGMAFALVRKLVGVWCAPWFSPQAFRTAWATLRRRRSPC